jgi:spermidine/putrescine transport system permease protein
MERPVPTDLRELTRRRKRRGRALAPYALLGPGGVWLLILFIVPMFSMGSLALQEGNALDGFVQTYRFANFADVFSKNEAFIVRSLRNGAIVTVLSLVIAYPVAYWIAFYGGKVKNVFLFLVLLPFLVAFTIRTVAWQFILSDNGLVLTPLKSIGLLPDDIQILNTSLAVIAGITYNLLPFTVLPLYVSLERIDKSVVEAAKDLYSTRFEAFRKVVFPLSLPGVFAAILLTSIPAVGDYLNAAILGGPGDSMIGNVISSEFLVSRDYPEASALAFLLMAVLLIGAILYARVLGTEEVTT